MAVMMKSALNFAPHSTAFSTPELTVTINHSFLEKCKLVCANFESISRLVVNCFLPPFSTLSDFNLEEHPMKIQFCIGLITTIISCTKACSADQPATEKLAQIFLHDLVTASNAIDLTPAVKVTCLQVSPTTLQHLQMIFKAIHGIISSLKNLSNYTDCLARLCTVTIMDKNAAVCVPSSFASYICTEG